jgi:hypothetical protein
MTHFLKFLEVCRTEGIAFINKKDDHGLLRQQTPEEKDWKHFEQCQPFVFDNPPEARTTEDVTLNIDEEKIELSAPFKVFSCEFLDESYKLQIHELNQESRKAFCECVVVIEKTPGQFLYFLLTKIVYGEHIKQMADEIFISEHLDTYYRVCMVDEKIGKPIVYSYLRLLDKWQIGTENTRQRVKIGRGKNKRVHTIRRIVHVAPKKALSGLIYDHRSIDWSHRWLVRGHWRKHDGLGKDRDGDYCVHGFTWVQDHEKGPEHLPLVKKTRIVETVKEIK